MPEVDALVAWRRSTLTLFARLSLILVLPIVLLSMVNDLLAGRLGLALMGPLSYIIVIGVAFWERPSPRLRATLLILTGYVMGVVLFSLGGFITAGSTLLLMASIFAALMLRPRSALIFATLSTATILLVLGGHIAGVITLAPGLTRRLTEPVVLLANGLLLIYVIWFLVAAIFSLLRQLSESLRATEAANASLERRVAERTAELQAALGQNRTVADQLQLILRTIPEQFWLKDPSGRYVLVSDTLARFHNLEPEAMRGRTARELYPPDMAALIDEPDRKVLTERRASFRERQVVDYGGQERWFESSRTPLFDERGDLVGLVGIARDVTARREAEEALARQLRYSEALAQCSRTMLTYAPTPDAYQRVLEQALDILRVAADGGRIAVYHYLPWEQGLTKAPPQFRLVVAANAPDLPPQHPATPEVALDFPAEINALMAAGNVFNGPARFPNHPVYQAYNDSNGTISVCYLPLFVGGKWWGHMSLNDYKRVRIWDDAVVQMMRTAAEMIVTFTRGWEAAQALSASEQRYRSLVNVLPDTALLLFAPDLRFTLATGPALAAAGLTPAAIEGRSIDEVAGHAEAQAMGALLRQALGGQICHVEQSVGGRTYDIHVMPLHGSGELIAGGMLVARDITLAKDVERALRRAAEAAEAADRAKSSFLAMMSHEIRTPLNAVIGMTSLLLESDLSPAQREFADVISSSGAALLALINDILDLSRIEAGQVTLESQPFDLARCLHESLSLVAQAAADKGLALRSAIDPALPPYLVGDKVRLRQIMVNLLSNAVKFTHQGEVTLQVTTDDGRQTAGQPGAPPAAGLSSVVFAVRDTGIGISAAEQARIFQPFVQADSSTTRRYGGSGLGLPISRQLAELMGGSLTVQSAPGQGATFTLALPLQVGPAPPPPPEPTSPDQALASRQLRVLIVEDNPINQRVILLLIERLGLRADLVADGVAAVEALAGRPYDVVLMDVQMPRLDGEEATRRIRALGDAIRQPYIIALTAHAFAGNREQALAAGMDAYLTKPVQIDALRAALNQAIRQAGLAPLGPGGPPARPETTDPVNWPALRELFAAVSDSPAEAADLLRNLFHRELRLQVISLLAALAADDRPRAAGIAHTLAGAASQIGAVALAGLAREAEACLRGEGPGPSADLGARIEAAYQEADAFVMARLAAGDLT